MKNESASEKTFLDHVLGPWLNGSVESLTDKERPMMQALARRQVEIIRQRFGDVTPDYVIRIHDLCISFLFAHRADMKALKEDAPPKPHARLHKVLRDPAWKPPKAASGAPKTVLSPVDIGIPITDCAAGPTGAAPAPPSPNGSGRCQGCNPSAHNGPHPQSTVLRRADFLKLPSASDQYRLEENPVLRANGW